MNQDGSNRAKVLPYSDRRDSLDHLSRPPLGITALVPKAPQDVPGGDGNFDEWWGAATPMRQLLYSGYGPRSEGFCSFRLNSRRATSPGRSLAIPLGPGESLPDLPPEGIAPLAEPSVVKGAQSVPRAYLVPGKDPEHYAFVNTTVHRNLYRISLPMESFFHRLFARLSQ